MEGSIEDWRNAYFTIYKNEFGITPEYREASEPGFRGLGFVGYYLTNLNELYLSDFHKIV